MGVGEMGVGKMAPTMKINNLILFLAGREH